MIICMTVRMAAAHISLCTGEATTSAEVGQVTESEAMETEQSTNPEPPTKSHDQSGELDPEWVGHLKSVDRILGGEMTVRFHQEFLIRNNHTDLQILKNIKVSTTWTAWVCDTQLYARFWQLSKAWQMNTQCAVCIYVYTHTHINHTHTTPTPSGGEPPLHCTQCDCHCQRSDALWYDEWCVPEREPGLAQASLQLGQVHCHSQSGTDSLCKLDSIQPLVDCTKNVLHMYV